MITKKQPIALYLLALLAALLAAGCSEPDPSGDFEAVLSGHTPATVNPLPAELVITPESTGTLDLSWTAADFGTKIPSSYTVVLSDESGTKRITYPISAGQRELSIPLLELNKRLVTELELQGGVPGKVALTVEAIPLSEKGNPVVLEKYRIASQPMLLTITPFFATVRPDLYFLVGDVSGRDGAPVWDPASTDMILLADDNDALTYHYYGYFKSGAEFKIFPEECIGGWDKPVLGLKDDKIAQTGDAANMKLLPEGAPAGYYHLTFTVNRGTLDPAQATIAFESYPEGDSAPLYDRMGIIGTAGIDWDHDLFLEASPAEPHLWIGRGLTLKEGDFKIRANAAWDVSWGGSADQPFPTNFGIVAGGDDWKVTADEAGLYDIYFNDLTGHFFFNKLEE